MAGRIQTKNVYVDTEYDNIIIIDPNIVRAEDGSPIERLVQHEDLVYYANLETKIVPRTKLAVGETVEIVNTTIASFIGGDENTNLNFLRPKNKRGTFDTSWSDQLTGQGSRGGAGFNQTTEQVSEIKDSKGNTKTVFNRNITNYQDTQTLGIKSISVKIRAAGVPEVNITLVDVQGRTLFEQGENSLYSVFFNLPYPAFYLTLKGYYGKAIRYQLALVTFNAKLDPKSGNFDISLKLIGRPGALLFDTVFGYSKNVPKMFKKKYVVGKETKETYLGRQYLNEVYAEYKAKKLIPEDFPNFSIEDFSYRLEDFLPKIKEEGKRGDFQILGDVYTFRRALDGLRQEVYYNTMNNYVDQNNAFSIGGEIYYPFKTEINKTIRNNYTDDVNSAITTYLDDLDKNATFGKTGKYKIEGFKEEDSRISPDIRNSIKFENIVKQKDLNTLSEKDYEDTFFIRTGKTKDQDEQGYSKFRSNIAITVATLGYVIDNTGTPKKETPTFFVFGIKNNGKNELVETPIPGFLKIIENAEAKLKTYEQEIESKLSELLAKKITDTKKGLGFIPSIRNVFAVLFAGVDAFYRMMDDTHRKAWEQREDKKRKEVILSDINKTEKNDNDTNTVVYPWPQYYVQKNENGRNLYEIQYPGNPQFVNQTKANDYTIWPEVQFTEEYLTAASLKLAAADNSTTYTDPTKVTKKSQLNSIYFNYQDDILQTFGDPFRNMSMSVEEIQQGLIDAAQASAGGGGDNPYFNTNRSGILFEILERSYINANYGKFNYPKFKTFQIDKLIADLEGENIKDAIKDIVILTEIFKNTTFTYETYKNYLKSNFIQQWWYYENNLFSTPYLEEMLLSNNQDNVLAIDYLTSKTVTTGSDLEKNFSDYLKSTNSNGLSFLDTYPFTNNPWLKNNMADGIKITGTDDYSQTTKTFKIQESLKKVARLDTDVDGKNINLLTNNKLFNNSVNNTPTVQNSSGQQIAVNSRETLKQYFEERNNNPNSLFVTETVIDYGNEYSGQVKTKIQTTSLLNTPYFVNAILRGVELEKTSGETPYAALGYLYLNSLPLITTREKLKTFDGATQTDLDYLSASLNKFSAIHQVPYAWVLKYGSIWHRYKKWVETGVDILDDNYVWKDFDAASAWDPSGSSKSKIYSGTTSSGTPFRYVLQEEVSGPPLGIPSVVKSYNVGFYPKLYNDVYYFFSKKNLYSAYTSEDIFVTGNNRISGAVLPLNIAPTINNAWEQTILKTNINYYKVKDDTNLPFFNEDSEIKFPSPDVINQAILECFDASGTEKIPLIDNPAFYNGTIKTLNDSPHFGYYDHSKIKKPQPWEYIKKININKSEQSAFDLLNNSEEYSTIEEIFGIFNKETLDLFETQFLYFIEPNPDIKAITLPFENTSATITTPANISNITNKRLYWQMKNLFVVSDRSQQMESFTEGVKEFLEYDVILRIGNPGNFDRQIFNEFTNATKYLPTSSQVKYQYSPYSGNLPPLRPLVQSRGDFPEEWKALQLYVGFSTINGLEYYGTSIITDFFRVMDIQFTVDNIKRFSQIIKLYVTKKIEDPTLGKTKFQNLLIDYLNQKDTYQGELLNETLLYLKKNLPDITSNQSIVQSTLDSDVIKLETYSTLKALNDKWIAGSELQNKTIFEDFLFYDRANSDVGDAITVDLEYINGLIKQSDKLSMMDIVGMILDKNHFLFFAMPAYVNFYNLQKAVREGGDIPYEIPNSMFGTFLNVDYINSKPKFLCMYLGNSSEHLSNESEFNRFGDDVLDLRKTTNTIRRDSDNIDKERENLVCGFNVDFGIRNQNIFSDLSLDMSEQKNTSETFRVNAELANSASADKVAQQSTSLYSIYRTRSYNCGVTSMGNAMIQPTMYFNLRHVPLFRGAYFIHEVNHSIDEKQFKTDFTGMRIPLYTLPKPDGALASVNRNLLESIRTDAIKTKVEKWDLSTGFTRNPNATVNNTPVADSLSVCKSAVTTDYQNIPFVDSKTTTTTDSSLINLLNQLVTNNLLRAYLFGITHVTVGNKVNQESISSFNNNLFTIPTTNKYYANLNDFVVNQTCVKINNVSTPLIAFNTMDDAIKMESGKQEPRISIIPKIVTLITDVSNESDKYAKALAMYYIETFENIMSNPTEEKVYNSFNARLTRGDISQAAFDSYVKIFKQAYGKFF